MNPRLPAFLIPNGRKEPPPMTQPPRYHTPLSPEDEDLSISVRGFRELQERCTSAEIDRDHFRSQLEIWKARAEAEAALLLDIKRERDKLADFKTEMVRQFKNCNNMIVEMMAKATDFALRPQEFGEPDRSAETDAAAERMGQTFGSGITPTTAPNPEKTHGE